MLPGKAGGQTADWSGSDLRRAKGLGDMLEASGRCFVSVTVCKETGGHAFDFNHGL